MIKEFLKLGNYVNIKWRYFALGVIFMIVGALLNGLSLSSIVPLLDIIIAGREILLPDNLPVFVASRLGKIVEILNAIPPVNLLKYLIAFIIGVIFLKGLFFYFHNYFFYVFGNRILTDLRERIYSKITSLSMDFFSYEQSGDITSKIIFDVNRLMSSFVKNFPALIFKGSLVIVYLVMIFMINWRMSIFALLIFPPLILPITNMGKKLRKLGGRVQESYGMIGNLVHEGIYGQQIIKAYNQEERIVEKFKKENEKIFRTVMSATKRILLISPFTEIIAALGASGLIYFGTKQVIEGSMGPGFLFLFFVSLFSIVSPIKGVASNYANLKHESAALIRIFGVLEKENSVKDSGTQKLQGIKDFIEFRNTTFAYKDRIILNNINLKVQKGERIGIVGHTGAGKTTMVGLILRLYDPISGRILFDGTDIRHFTLRSLREKIGFVTQEPILFYDTIEKNITLADRPEQKKLERALQISGLSNIVESMPMKLETMVGERGTTLSGGQKQLLSIARAIYKDPEILILDEATASLDSSSETLLQKALEKIMEGHTVFIIAHRLSTLRNADRIIFIKDGGISEEGCHETLFNQQGDYYRLWSLQYSSGKKIGA